MLNVLAVPGEVFERVIGAPVNLANWRAPALLVCLAGLINFTLRPNNAWGAGEPLAGSIVVIAASISGSMWTGLVLWLIGRFCLKVRFSAAKALEIAGLTGTIMALGQIATMLLAIAFGSHAHPSLALLAPNLPVESGVRQSLEVFNLFDLWTAAVLCIGLSKLARVSVKEASFWVFGYWVVLRLVLIAGS
jgi:hypothetical protein